MGTRKAALTVRLEQWPKWCRKNRLRSRKSRKKKFLERLNESRNTHLPRRAERSVNSSARWTLFTLTTEMHLSAGLMQCDFHTPLAAVMQQATKNWTAPESAGLKPDASDRES